MFGSVALDIFLGLVLIYLLYSLLITIVGEMLSTWFGLRARMLRMSIELMLNDKNYYTEKKHKWWRLPWFKIQKFWLREFKDFNYSLAGRFYQQPSIKYLSNGDHDRKGWFDQRKPSYFSNDFFADTLINMLRNKGEGNTDIEKIIFCFKYNTLHIQEETLKNLQNFLSNSGNDLNAFKDQLKKWYDETQDRTNGWYKKKMQFILFWLGFILAVIFNIDSIEIARSLSKDKEARNKLIDMGIQLSKDSMRYSRFVTYNDSAVNSDAVIDSGLSHISNDINEASNILGLGWSSLEYEEIDSVQNNEINQKAYENYIARQNALVSQDSLLNNYKICIASINHFNDQKAKFLIKENDIKIKFVSDSSSKNYLLDSIYMLKALNDSLLLFMSQRLTLDSTAFLANHLLILNKSKQIKFESAKNFLSPISAQKTKDGRIVIKGRVEYGLWCKFLYLLRFLTFTYLKSWGFVITALAISLGAPFWFDLLKKLIALRGAGVKPEEKEEEIKRPLEKINENPPQLVNLQVISKLVDSLDEALDRITNKLKDEHGIVAIALETSNDGVSGSIAVYVENINHINYLKSKYGQAVILENNNKVPLTYSVSNPIITHRAECGGEISNQSNNLGSGTLGCFLSKKGSDKKYILSCWHVMSDSSNWNHFNNSNIVDSTNTNKIIGRIEDGILSNNLDIGIAEYIADEPASNSSLPIKSQHRAVSSFDALMSTNVTLIGKVTKIKQVAKIVHHKVNAILQYPREKENRVVFDTFSIAIISENGNLKAPTNKGDSGAVIVDEKGVPLGMIIGGNDKVSYAVKFSNAFDSDKTYHQYSFLTT